MEMLSNLDMKKNQVLNLVLQVLAGNHGAPSEGLIWYDSSAKSIKYYDGSEVRTLGISGGGGDADTLNGNAGSYYLDRANHTGTQLAETISDLVTAVEAIVGEMDDIDAATLDGNTAADLRDRSTHTGTQTASTISDFNNAVRLNRLDQMATPAANVALGGYKITGLADPTDAQDAATRKYVLDQIAALVASAPETLDTLNELAQALGEDPNFATTVTNLISGIEGRVEEVESAIEDLQSGVGGYSATVGNGSDTDITVTHNLGTRNVIVQVFRTASPYDTVGVDVERTSIDTVTLKFAMPPSAGQFTVLVQRVAGA